MRDPKRLRRIVKLAASWVKDPSAREWLTQDERGVWETEAAGHLESTEEVAKGLGLTAAQVDEQIAIRLALDALKTTLAHARRRSKA